jgi:hypothetical protein
MIENLGRALTTTEAAQMSREESLGISKDFLLENFTYNDGLLLRNKTTGNTRENGQWGTMHGYRRIKIKGNLFQVHRLIWIMFFGYIPHGRVIDHVNRDKLDNRIENLRCVTLRANSLNCERSDKESRNMYLDRRVNKWRVMCSYRGKKVFVGMFPSHESALAVAKNANATMEAIE